MEKKKVLTLSVNKQPFDVMITGEKSIEFRDNTKFIRDRLYNKDGSIKSYDVVKIVNGYGNHRPHFVAKFLYFDQVTSEASDWSFSNGLEVKEKPGMFRIYLGTIGIRRNIK